MLPVCCGITVETPVYGSVYRRATLRKLFGPERKRLIIVTSNGNSSASCHYRGRGFDSHTLHHGGILILVVIICIDKNFITHRITCVDKNIVLALST